MNLVTGKLHERRKVMLGVSLLSLLAIPLVACSGATAGQSPLLPTEPEAAVTSSEELGVPATESLTSEAVIQSIPATSTPSSSSAEPLITGPRIIAEPTLAKASFQVTDLVVTPAQVQPGGQIIVTANLTNSGTSEGSDEIELKINGVTQVVKEVTLPAGVTQELYFSGYMMPGAEPGAYTADLEGLTTQFVVSTQIGTLILSSPDPGLEPVAPISNQTTPSCCSGSSTTSSGSSCCGISSDTTSSRGGCGCGR